jgi:hypothetical protein
MKKLKGDCLCGAIRYSCNAEPIIAFACHCRFCQRSSGAAFRAAMSFKSDDLEFSGAKLKQYTHKAMNTDVRFMCISALPAQHRLWQPLSAFQKVG